MKHIVRKPYWNYEKEEKWLNEMSQKGLALIDYTWCRYVFEDEEKGKYQYRIELLEQTASHPESKKYIEFLEESGLEHVTSYMRWIYIRKRADQGEFNLFSDIDSKLKHYKRVNRFWLTLIIMDFVIGLNNIYIGLVVNDINKLSSINLWGGIFCIVVAALLFIMSMGVRKKIMQLKEQKMIEE